MKHFFATLLLALASCLGAAAQDGLATERLFDHIYASRKDVTEVWLTDAAKLSDYNLNYFRSLVLTPSAKDSETFEQRVLLDAEKAISREEGRRSGRLYYGFYRLRPAGNGDNRYIFFRNNALRPGSDGRLTLIYMRGKATPEELRQKFAK